MWQRNFEPKDTVTTDHLRSTKATKQLVLLSVQPLKENAAKHAQDKQYSEETSTICDKTMRAVCFQGDLCSHQPPYFRLPSPITLKWMPATLFILSFILCIICMIKGEPHALSHQPELKGWNRCTAEPSMSTPHSERTHTCPSRLYKLLKQLSCRHSWRTTWGKNETTTVHSEYHEMEKTLLVLTYPLCLSLTVRLMLHPLRGNKTGSRSAKDL